MDDIALWFVIAVALAFDFTNGFHDAANSIAKVVASGLSKIGVFIVLAPLIGLALAFIVVVVVLHVAKRAHNVDRLNRSFRRMQLLSAGAYSLGHGGNDAQKTMGIILALLIATHRLGHGAGVPFWVVLTAH